uniref:C-type lectin domain-containing protein n=1 Tax=Latimeria chalumnae TaxID=7897 RepID=H2ZWJ6_LATCH
SAGCKWKCCPVDWTLFQDSCYYFSSAYTKWSSTRRRNKKMSNHQSLINLRQSSCFLFEFLEQSFRYGWIGLYNNGTGWRWVSGDPCDSSVKYCSRNEPGGKHKCVSIYPSNWGYVDGFEIEDCDGYNEGTCEKEALCF